jgi:hypothetical protein
MDYYEEFAKLAKKNEIWFAVCADGRIDYATDTQDGGDDMYVSGPIVFGSPEAVEWLKKEIAIRVEQLKNELCNHKIARSKLSDKIRRLEKRINNAKT